MEVAPRWVRGGGGGVISRYMTIILCLYSLLLNVSHWWGLYLPRGWNNCCRCPAGCREIPKRRSRDPAGLQPPPIWRSPCWDSALILVAIVTLQTFDNFLQRKNRTGTREVMHVGWCFSGMNKRTGSVSDVGEWHRHKKQEIGAKTRGTPCRRTLDWQGVFCFAFFVVVVVFFHVMTWKSEISNSILEVKILKPIVWHFLCPEMKFHPPTCRLDVKKTTVSPWLSLRCPLSVSFVPLSPCSI